MLIDGTATLNPQPSTLQLMQLPKAYPPDNVHRGGLQIQWGATCLWAIKHLRKLTN